MRALLAFLLAIIGSPALTPTEMRLERQVRSWQKRLGLEDWEISLRVVRQTELARDVWGASEWNDRTRKAVIKVLDPRDYNLRGGELRLDMECTIVHELVHIQVSPLDARDAGTREEVVNKIMAALLNRPCPN
jgi:hypothetical protein